MKKLSTFSAVIFCMMMNGQYCTPVFQYGADSNMITHVSFGTINNTSTSQSANVQAYEDFTSMSADIQAGNSYQISVKGPSSTFPSDVMVFIDFNKNGSFDDAGESFYIGRLEAANPFNALTVTGTVSVPAHAASGTTRMRVLKNTNTAAYSDPNAPNSILTACDDSLRAGQTEDYTVNITGSNVIFPTPYCGAENITTLTVSEITKVEFTGITNESHINGTLDALENFTGTVFNVNRGNSYPITITGETQGQTTVSAYAYIDLNHNNAFDANEVFNLGYLDNSDPVPGKESGVTTGTIEIPADAMLGETRFRIVKAYESNSWMGTLENLPCPAGWFIGQAEDYTLNVLASNLATSETSKKSPVKIYPNPTSGTVILKTEEKLEKYEVYSLSGQKMIEGTSGIINMDHLATGTYLIRIYTGDKKIITEKIIKK
ncbi:T9SS type A sorting domain-containing protein [Chryseobacterium oranimense]|uniref:T9SS type A sorting domain-containing protein n=1 Tax=Chryseobacterium oranimense TaxID=421058 RepID=UPI0021AFCDF5|nr:T9SS type A sorting domain-containing protein [Chryseobacterium oranimense]UWX62016.1 T9SS type A sorting domain-containing protein [Chryseobacterium oranimense]